MLHCFFLFLFFFFNVIHGHYDIDVSNKLISVRTEIQVIT